MSIEDIIDTLAKGKKLVGRAWVFGHVKTEKCVKLRKAIDEAIVLLAVYRDAGVDELRHHVELFKPISPPKDGA